METEFREVDLAYMPKYQDHVHAQVTIVAPKALYLSFVDFCSHQMYLLSADEAERLGEILIELAEKSREKTK